MITHRMLLHGSNKNGNNALKHNVAFRSRLIHEEEMERCNLIAVPEKVLEIAESEPRADYG